MTAALARTPTTWRPACTDQPERWFHQDGDRSHDWWRPAVAICHHCPIRRACIETELAVRSRAAGGDVYGGWWWSTGGDPHPHPADRDLWRRYYPEASR